MRPVMARIRLCGSQLISTQEALTYGRVCTWMYIHAYMGHVVLKCVEKYADSERQDQPTHPRDMIRSFAVCLERNWKL